MKTEILSSEEITKEMAIHRLSNSILSKEEIDEYLEIMIAISKGQQVFNFITNNGEYLMFLLILLQIQKTNIKKYRSNIKLFEEFDIKKIICMVKIC